MGGSDEQRGPASDAGAASSTINDWRVDQTKRRFRDRLLEAAGRVAGGARLKGKTRLSHLARVCHVQPSTVQRQLASEVRLLVPIEEGDPGQGLPDWQTIYKLVRGTEVPAYLWLYDLGVLTLQDAAALLAPRTNQPWRIQHAYETSSLSSGGHPMLWTGLVQATLDSCNGG